jgi:hypothetical protein
MNQLEIIKSSCNSLLRRNIEKNLEKYYSEKPFIAEYFKENNIENFSMNTNILVEDFDLKIGGPETDCENAIIVHKALKDLMLIEAREEKIWTNYTHLLCWDYMKKRWPLNEEKNKNYSKIKARYFFSNSSDNKIKSSATPYVRNGIARLWWGAHIVYNKDLPDPYEYVKHIFNKQDVFVGISEREFAKNQLMVFAILDNINKYNLFEKKNSTDLIRSILKEINFQAGLILFDFLSKEEINDIVEKITIEQIKKYSTD